MPTSTDLSPWATVGVIVCIAISAVGLAAILEWDRRRKFAGGDRREQIRRLTESLNESLVAINAITAEIDQGQQILVKLERELADKKHAAALTSAEAEAVGHLIQQELRRERRLTLIRDVLLTFIGVVIGLLLQSVWQSWFS